MAPGLQLLFPCVENDIYDVTHRSGHPPFSVLFKNTIHYTSFSVVTNQFIYFKSHKFVYQNVFVLVFVPGVLPRLNTHTATKLQPSP